jgi:hypothetical protein
MRAKNPNTQYSNDENEIEFGDCSFSYPGFSRSTKKRRFEFNLSQSDPAISTTPTPGVQNEASEPTPSQQTERFQLSYSASDASRRSILDCIEEMPCFEESHLGAGFHALPSAISARFETHNSKAKASDFADEGLAYNCCDELFRTVPKSGRYGLDEIREFDGVFDPSCSQNLRRTHVNFGDCRQESPMKASRPQLPGPAALGSDPPEEGTDKNSPSVHLELPLRTRHICVSPSDPDFNAFSWEKMLRDLDLDPFTGW